MTKKRILAHIVMFPFDVVYGIFIIVLAPVWIPVCIIIWAYHEINNGDETK